MLDPLFISFMLNVNFTGVWGDNIDIGLHKTNKLARHMNVRYEDGQICLVDVDTLKIHTDRTDFHLNRPVSMTEISLDIVISCHFNR